MGYKLTVKIRKKILSEENPIVAINMIKSLIDLGTAERVWKSLMKKFSMWEILPISCILTSKKGAIIDVNPSAEILPENCKEKICLIKQCMRVFS